jgi:phosphonate transport system substrate-binding protein
MRRRLRFATFLASNMFPVYQAIADHVGEQLGCTTELVVGDHFEVFAQGDADIGFLCGLPYVRLMGEPEPPIELVVAPVLQGARYAERPIYFSDVIVRRDSPWHHFADLHGRTWAYNDPDSHSGYNVTRARLVALGQPTTFFGRIVRAGSHQRALRMVVTGEVDASAIDSQVLAIEQRDHPELAASLRVIETLGPSTIQPVIAARRLPIALRRELHVVLVAMGSDPTMRSDLDRGLIARFAPISDADYDDIRRMLAAVEAAQVPAW